MHQNSARAGKPSQGRATCPSCHQALPAPGSSSPRCACGVEKHGPTQQRVCKAGAGAALLKNTGWAKALQLPRLFLETLQPPWTFATRRTWTRMLAPWGVGRKARGHAGLAVDPPAGSGLSCSRLLALPASLLARETARAVTAV